MSQGKLRGIIYVLIATFTFGVQGVLARMILISGGNPVMMTSVKVVAGAVGVAIMALILRKKVKIEKKDLLKLIIGGVVGCLLMSLLLSTAYNIVGASQGVIYLYTAPAITVLIARFYLKERITPLKGLAVVSVLAGTILVALGAGGSSYPFNVWGFLAGIGAALGYSIFGIISKDLSTKYDSFTVNFMTVFFAAVGSLFIFPPWNWGSAITNPTFIWMCVYGLLVYVIANYFFVKSAQHLEAGQTMLIANTEPVIGVILAAIVLGEKVTLIQVVGFLLIIGAVVLISLGREKVKVKLKKEI